MNSIVSIRKNYRLIRQCDRPDYSQIGYRLRISGEITPCNNRDGRHPLLEQKTVDEKRRSNLVVQVYQLKKNKFISSIFKLFWFTKITSRSAIDLLHSLQTKQSGCQFFPKQLKKRPYPRGCLHPAQPPVALGLSQHHPTKESSQKFQEDSLRKDAH